jgi:hypothetical protein
VTTSQILDTGRGKVRRCILAELMSRKRSPRSYRIYIIELSRACMRTPCALAPLYVGQTAHTPEERFAQHKEGGMLAAGKAHRYGVRLRYDLMKGIGPFTTRSEAEQAEKAIAEALERRGHRVFWG